MLNLKTYDITLHIIISIIIVVVFVDDSVSEIVRRGRLIMAGEGWGLFCFDFYPFYG